MRAGRALREKWEGEARMADPEFARRYAIHCRHGEYVSRVIQRYGRLCRAIEGTPITDDDWDRRIERTDRQTARLRAKCPCGDHGSSS